MYSVEHTILHGHIHTGVKSLFCCWPQRQVCTSICLVGYLDAAKSAPLLVQCALSKQYKTAVTLYDYRSGKIVGQITKRSGPPVCFALAVISLVCVFMRTGEQEDWLKAHSTRQCCKL